tara:strand:+ start:176 stop:673 length:498 start_codon:yes stop_codon:yes gene_type:complete
MEPISAALTGFALLKTAVSGLKSAINTANDVKDVGHFLEAIWKADKECNEQHNKNASVGSLDTFKDVASNVIDRRLQQEMMHEVRTLITARFGIQCWETIVAEKAKREREIKEAQAAARKEAARKSAELEEAIKTAAIVASIIGIAIALFIALLVTVASAQRMIA